MVAGAVHEIEDQGLAMPAILDSYWVYGASKRIEAEKKVTMASAGNATRNKYESRARIYPAATETAVFLRAMRLLESSNDPRVRLTA